MGFPCWTGKGKGIKDTIPTVWMGNIQSVKGLNKQEGARWTINFLPTENEHPSSAIWMELTSEVLRTQFLT